MHLTCNRCGHEWTTRGESKPSKCSRCKSRRYDEPRVYALTWTQTPKPTALRPSFVRRRPETAALAARIEHDRAA